MWRRGLLLGLAFAMVITVATPAIAAPELQVSPGAGAAGESVTVIGAGFAAGEVEIRWGSQSGPLLATATGPDFFADVTIPEAEPNSYPVVAVVREGSAVSTSNTSFQVVAAEEVTTTTVATVAPTPPSARDAVVPPSRGGGIDGGLPDTTSGVDADPDPPTVNTTVPATPTSPANTPTTAPEVTVPPSAATTPTGAPAGGATGSVDMSTVPGAAEATPRVAGNRRGPGTGGDERVASAPQPASTSQSSGVIQSPALLVAGLALVVGGIVVLAVRSRRPSGGHYS